MAIHVQRDRSALISLFERHHSAHVYALADLDEPYWSRSTWWQRGDAAVGLIGIPDVDTAVVYAVSPADPGATKTLLADLASTGLIPDRFVITGPTGLVDALARCRRRVWSGAHQRMLLVDHPSLDVRDVAVRTLNMDDIVSIESLRAADPNVGGFFYPGLVELGLHLGAFVGGRLVSMAGVHVASRDFGVVAIGNVATHPDHRRRGLAALVLVKLIEKLKGDFAWIGLNVNKANLGAIRLYQRLGFERVMDYEEGEFDSAGFGSD